MSQQFQIRLGSMYCPSENSQGSPLACFPVNSTDSSAIGTHRSDCIICSGINFLSGCILEFWVDESWTKRARLLVGTSHVHFERARGLTRAASRQLIHRLRALCSTGDFQQQSYRDFTLRFLCNHRTASHEQMQILISVLKQRVMGDHCSANNQWICSGTLDRCDDLGATPASRAESDTN